MLKIRISGTEKELRQIAHKVGSASIKRYKHSNGKTTFALDVTISVYDFLQSMDLSAENTVSGASHCDPKEIQQELENLLQEISTHAS